MTNSVFICRAAEESSRATARVPRGGFFAKPANDIVCKLLVADKIPILIKCRKSLETSPCRLSFPRSTQAACRLGGGSQNDNPGVGIRMGHALTLDTKQPNATGKIGPVNSQGMTSTLRQTEPNRGARGGSLRQQNNYSDDRIADISFSYTRRARRADLAQRRVASCCGPKQRTA